MGRFPMLKVVYELRLTVVDKADWERFRVSETAYLGEAVLFRVSSAIMLPIYSRKDIMT